ncbi:MAG: hypothetical protein ACRDN9_02245 [Streptosporangiaceae bacterium]
MNENPSPDYVPVYHGDRLNGHHPPASAPAGPPRLFVLAFPPLDDAPPEGGAQATLDLEDVVAWGLEFADEALVYLRYPDDGRRAFGVFGSARRALAVYGRLDDLRLVYLS